MASFIIEGGHKLHGEIHPQGAKNEALQIICATVLTAEEVIVDNVPNNELFIGHNYIKTDGLCPHSYAR